MSIDANWLDIVIIVILAVNVFNGFQRGLIRTLFGISALLIALFVCVKGTPLVASILQQFKFSGAAAYALALVAIFVIIYFLVNDLGRNFREIIKESSFEFLDSLGGVILGFAKGTIYVLFLLIPLLGNMFSSPMMIDTLEHSQFVDFGRPLITQAQPLIENIMFEGQARWTEYQKEFQNLSEKTPLSDSPAPRPVQIITNF